MAGVTSSRRAIAALILLVGVLVLAGGGLRRAVSTSATDVAGERQTADVSTTAKLQETLDAAPAGATVTIGEMHLLTAPLQITKPVTLRCTPRDAGLRGPGGVLLRIVNAHDVSVSGCTFRSGFPTAGGAEALAIERSRSVRVIGCTFLDLRDGVTLTDVRDVEVRQNRFQRLGNSAVALHDPGPQGHNEGVRVDANEIVGYQQLHVGGNAAIQADSAGHADRQVGLHVTRNDIRQAPLDNGVSVGIGLDQARDSEVVGNRVTGGGPRSGEGIVYTGGSGKIVGNVVRGNGAAGILLFSSRGQGTVHDVEVSSNASLGNRQGIAIVWGSGSGTIRRVDIHGNRCHDSGAGRQLYGVQSYAEGGATVSGAQITIHGNDLRGNLNGAMNLVPGTDASTWDNWG